MSAKILLQKASLNSLAEIWSTLEWIYVSSSQRQVKYMLHDFSTIQKGGTSMFDYISQASHLLDMLGMVRETLTQSEIIITISNGLRNGV